MGPMFAITTWPQAHEELERLLPGCRAFLPDAIAEAAAKAGSPPRFIPLDGWEAMEDEAILRKILPARLGPSEKVLAITDASFTKAAPFLLEIGDMPGFPKAHLAQFGEGAFNGDAIFIIPRKMIVLFYHSGHHASIDLGGAGDSMTPDGPSGHPEGREAR